MQVLNHIHLRDNTAYIAGRNLKAEMVARMYVDTDYSIEDVMGHYNLSAAEVHAALAYYYDNQAELDARRAATEAAIAEEALTLEQFKARIAEREANQDNP
jgi:uncharacterized protein (DUF433 family)